MKYSCVFIHTSAANYIQVTRNISE